MAIQATVKVTYQFTPDGAGPLSVPSAQSLSFVLMPAGPQSIAGTNLTMPNGNTVTLANLTTLNTQIATALTAYLTANPANVTTIAGWPTGNP